MKLRIINYIKILEIILLTRLPQVMKLQPKFYLSLSRATLGCAAIVLLVVLTAAPAGWEGRQQAGVWWLCWSWLELRARRERTEGALHEGERGHRQSRESISAQLEHERARRGEVVVSTPKSRRVGDEPVTNQPLLPARSPPSAGDLRNTQHPSPLSDHQPHGSSVSGGS